MSRVSSKSGLSPSATRGSNAIDLGKNSGVDMGRKTQPSVTSGGIGVTAEVGNIGGMSVTGGVSVEVSPIGISISGNPNYEDPSKSSISIGVGAEIPGGLLGVSGGLTVNTSTGEIIGGSIGGEIGGLGISLSSDEGNIGVEFTLQIPFTPIELSLGLGFPTEKKPTPQAVSENEPAPSEGDWFTPGNLPSLSANCVYNIVVLGQSAGTRFIKSLGYGSNESSQGYDFESISSVPGVYFKWGKAIPNLWSGGYLYTGYEIDLIKTPVGHVEIRHLGRGTVVIEGDLVKDAGVYYGDAPKIGSDLLVPGGYMGEVSRAQGDRVANEVTQVIDGYFMRRYSNFQIKIELAFCYGDPLPPPPTPTPTPTLTPTPTPFPNPPPRKKNMDTCCQENLKFLRAIYKGLGIAKFPGKLPETIIQSIDKKGELPAEPLQVPIADFVDLLDWQFRRDDERWGQWEIQIDVKDTDLTKEGEQGKQIKFPNLAESIAELEGQMLSVMANVDALVAITTKNLVESGMARQEAIKGYLAAKAIIKYMAFKSTEIDVPVPMTFTPGAETIDALVKESEGHIKGTDYVEKETLRDILLDLLQAAAVIRAVHWQKIDSKTDTKSQLLNLLKGTVDLAGLVSGPKKATEGEEKKFDPAENFEDFIDSVEDGFRNTTGITDIQNPYGKTPDRRPRIRQIGDNISQAGGKD